MTAPAAFKATFADWRTVKGRKQLQIIFEVPLEQQQEVLSVLGAPSPTDPAWCAIAPLNKEAVEAQSKAPEEPVHTKDKRRFEDLPPATQAGIRCGEAAFWRYLEERAGKSEGTINSEDEAAEWLRLICAVGSRSAFNGHPHLWRPVNASYEAWLRT